MALSGCGLFQAVEARFLRAAEDHETQHEVKQQLGPPQVTNATPSGEAMWVYQVYDWQPATIE